METLSQIQEKIKVCIIEALEIDGASPEDIGNEDPFFGTDEEPGIIQDSLAILEIASRLSEEFGILPSEFNETSFQNVNVLSEMIYNRLAEESLVQ
ncbi:MAG: hypothetical protein CMO01_33140 [Thalassobius sp.]|nr:hypothetical protein [Thalassovita sp.]|tara:strand:+ start:262 stop:549 length:288 start_codon:yes stop_codon:yes gene_type:complete